MKQGHADKKWPKSDPRSSAFICGYFGCLSILRAFRQSSPGGLSIGEGTGALHSRGV